MEKLEEQLEFEVMDEIHKEKERKAIKRELKLAVIFTPIYIGSGLLIINLIKYLEKSVPQTYEFISNHIKSQF